MNDELVLVVLSLREIKTRIIAEFSNKMSGCLSELQQRIAFSESSANNILDCIEDMDGNESDQYEEDLYESI